MSKLQLLRIHSFQEYCQLRPVEDKLLNISQNIENEILEQSKNQDCFEVDGYCKICNASSSFLVDYLYCNEVNNVKIPNWRERVICLSCQLNNRMRAAIHILLQESNPSPEAKIYLTEQVTPLYHYIKHKFPNTVGSEYFGQDIAPGFVQENNIRHESLTNLSFKDGEFDFILSFDVFEHIPNYQQAFSECYRVLNSTGRMIFTVPFIKNYADNSIRAKVVDDNGNIIHIQQPQYHGDPVNEGGILCFQDFGWQMLDELRALGFQDAAALIYWSDCFGYFGGTQIAFIAIKN
jgi:Methyltransferase domain